MTRAIAFIIVASLAAFVAGFVAGNKAASRAGVEIRRSEVEPYVEVWRDGELAAEWEPRDGAIYTLLDQVLRDDPAIYKPQPGDPAPEAPDPGRGRGPVLQEASTSFRNSRNARISRD